MLKKDFLTLATLESSEVEELLQLSADVKQNPKKYKKALKRQVLAMIFQKSSTRTRVSFEVGVYQLGGTGLFLSSSDLQLGRGETLSDTAKVLSRYVDGIMARVYGHGDIEELAANATVPVINGLSDKYHPCQALADYFTMREHCGELKGKKLCFIGDANNVYRSLVYGGIKLGVNVTLAAPKKYQPEKSFLESARAMAEGAGVSLDVTDDPKGAVAGADVVYTDVWASMGQEAERAERIEIFQPYQVNQELMDAAGPQARFMHCLPAHRGEEVTDEVADSPASVIFDEAENRMHAQKALMVRLMATKE
jgi:ornithine carbamoyltransferase